MEVNFASKLSQSNYFSEPFPHWIINDFFSDSQLEIIRKQFPSSDEIIKAVPSRKQVTVIKDQNSAYPINFNELNSLGGDRRALNILAKSWAHQKANVLQELKKFDFAANYNELIFEEELVQARGDFRATTPATISGTTQLGPHLDSEYEILAGLIYLKDICDSSSGGDLHLYKLRDNAPAKYASHQLRIPLRYIEKLKTIEYSYNSAFFFVSHPLAIHGVSTRSVGKHERRLINLSLELSSSGGLKMFDRSLIVDPNLSPKSRKPSLQARILRKLGFNLQPKTHKYGRYKWLKEEEL